MHTTPDGSPDAPARSLPTEADAHSADCGCPQASFRYVLDPAGRADGDDENIVFPAHLGDVTDNGHTE